MSAIEVTDLRKSFVKARRSSSLLKRLTGALRRDHESFEAVAGLSFRAHKGESIAFIGPNGAGKSTTIKILTGLLHPSAGDVRVLGLVPWKDREPLAFRIGSVFGQKSQLWLHLPPSDTFELLSRIYEMKRSDFLSRRDELVRLFELGDLQHTPTRKLSLGQRMRCEIAASLLHRPEIIFLDEPTIGLDPVAKSNIRNLISHANKDEGVTVFLTSHDAGDIEKLSKRVMIVNHGRLLFDDSTNRLRRDFLQKKEIDLKLEQAWSGELSMDGVEVLKAKGEGLKLSVDTARQSIEKVVSTLLARGGVEDITIQNAPLEDIIADIYRRQAVGR